MKKFTYSEEEINRTLDRCFSISNDIQYILLEENGISTYYFYDEGKMMNAIRKAIAPILIAGSLNFLRVKQILTPYKRLYEKAE